jgi:hypothetical protein
MLTSHHFQRHYQNFDSASTQQSGTSHKTCLRTFGRNGSVAWTSAVSYVGRTSNAFKVTMKPQTFLFQMVVTTCISVQYLWKYGFAKPSDNLYTPVYILPHKVCQTPGLLYLLFVWVETAVSTYARSPAVRQHGTLPRSCLYLPLSHSAPSYLVLVLVFGSLLRGIRYCTPWLILVGTLAEHYPFAKIADKRKIYAANNGPTNGKLNYQKGDKFYFETRRIVHGMLEVIFLQQSVKQNSKLTFFDVLYVTIMFFVTWIL